MSYFKSRTVGFFAIAVSILICSASLTSAHGAPTGPVVVDKWTTVALGQAAGCSYLRYKTTTPTGELEAYLLVSGTTKWYRPFLEGTNHYPVIALMPGFDLQPCSNLNPNDGLALVTIIGDGPRQSPGWLLTKNAGGTYIWRPVAKE